MIKYLDTTNGHNEEVVDAFNDIANYFNNETLLEIILHRWADDQDIASITEYLKDTLNENQIRY